MQNDMHDVDRERAISIVKNFVLPPDKMISNNPYFNKILEEDFSLNLQAVDLLNMG